MLSNIVLNELDQELETPQSTPGLGQDEQMTIGNA